MAAEDSSMPGVNGNHVQHQGHEQQQQNNGAHAQNGTPAPFTQTPSASQPTDISKDEVGWYFVEQYYTTLSRNPSKLYLFYNKRSQFVSGLEMDKVAVCIGQRAIADRIAELEFQDCKVRVTNVDSQASDSNIVIQVIGEISNKQQAHRKFTQTFVLATQTNGYFVLNDIFRYLVEEEGEAQPDDEPITAQATENTEDAPVAAVVPENSAVTSMEEPEPKVLTSSVDPIAIERDAQIVDKELEEKVLKAEPEVEKADPVVNGVAEAETSEDKVAVTEPKSEEAVVSEEGQTVAKLPEEPHEPEPTPAPSPPKQVAQPAAPAKPSAPKSWASLAASANKVAMPAIPAVSTAAATQQQRQAAPKSSAPTTNAPAVSSAPAAAPIAPAASTTQRDQSPAANSQDEWTAVGGNHNRQQSRQTNLQQQQPQPQQAVPQTRAYIKNVREEMDDDTLKTYLEKFGEVTHFDIARQKNCAFVDFNTPEQYQAALAANPHTVGTEKFYIEERRPRPGNTFVPRGQFQGGRGGRGGPQGGASRGNMQGGGRGNYAQRSRGGGPAGSRGRGGAVQAS